MSGFNFEGMGALIVSTMVERSKAEILADIARDIVPMRVGTFAELHDYVDANGYGGFFDGHISADDDGLLVNAVQEAVDAWLRSGGHRPVRLVTVVDAQISDGETGPVDALYGLLEESGSPQEMAAAIRQSLELDDLEGVPIDRPMRVTIVMDIHRRPRP